MWKGDIDKLAYSRKQFFMIPHRKLLQRTWGRDTWSTESADLRATIKKLDIYFPKTAYPDDAWDAWNADTPRQASPQRDKREQQERRL